ncbi:MAG: hypothetical protein LLF92_12180 [Planctomycetaceae bacterium]|nr:hypothetical protein [Planctomycetaceae bacterium]
MVEFDKAAAKFEIKDDVLHICHSGQCLCVSLNSPRFIFSEGLEYGNNVKPLSVSGEIASDKPLEITYDKIVLKNSGSLQVKLYLQWSASD